MKLEKSKKKKYKLSDKVDVRKSEIREVHEKLNSPLKIFVLFRLFNKP